jgi:hypothetical protein
VQRLETPDLQKSFARGRSRALIEASETVCELESSKSPALAIVRSQGQAEVTDLIGGKGGTRTLDPGIMRAEDRKNRL